MAERHVCEHERGFNDELDMEGRGQRERRTEMTHNMTVWHEQLNYELQEERVGPRLSVAKGSVQGGI